ncbi:MAG: M15 family metallopeptidase [Sporocytophaga sp.]|uniref:M15 family metallopeptidase n=1 Tax=Sporocytophaga sp. TaxID=2231183 RepID=UPI001B2F81FE|nr:M15 family metallopeptidase [Sporocytophaga sp.]MBO9701968.1 M15 family metallopeptidase [Sporocytophaga sp.]
MPADINLLKPEFRDKVNILLQNCLNRGVQMRPNETLRDPYIQAKYWRQSRPIEQIQQKIATLKNQNANFLASCIEKVGPQHGDHVTNAIPGLSWHQWGEAIDCYWVVDNRAVWDTKTIVNGLNGYMVYADEAVKLGLDAGYFWHSFQDIPHVQLRKESNPSLVYSLVEIDKTMKNKFGTLFI